MCRCADVQMNSQINISSYCEIIVRLSIRLLEGIKYEEDSCSGGLSKADKIMCRCANEYRNTLLLRLKVTKFTRFYREKVHKEFCMATIP